jgi:hypothetical protein
VYVRGREREGREKEAEAGGTAAGDCRRRRWP